MKPRASTPVSSRSPAAASIAAQPAADPTPDPVLADLGMPPATMRLWLRYWAVQSAPDRDLAKAARNDLVVQMQPWVREIAERVSLHTPAQIHRDDLINEMNKRLIGLIEKFDPRHRISFELYAGRLLVGACHDFLRKSGWIKRTDRKFRREAQEAREQFLSASGRDPSDAEWAEKLGLSAAAFDRKKPRLNGREMTSLNTAADAGMLSGENHLLQDNRTVDPLVQAQRREVVRLLCRGLQEKEREVLLAYYQLGLTMRQIGDRMHLSEARVSQLHARVLKTLRIKFAGRREELL